MKPLQYLLLMAMFVACSPYKKITLTASDRLSQKWQGSAEAAVNAVYGVYKQKSSVDGGYMISYDYSYTPPVPYKKPGDYQVTVSRQRSNTAAPDPTEHLNDQQQNSNLVVRRIDFYFDKAQHVQHVEAFGFPDSVYYVKRR